MKHFLAASVRCVEAEASLRLILRYGFTRHHKINKREYGAQILLKICLVIRVQISVGDPDSLNPDPAFQVNPDPDTDPVLGLDPGI